MPYLDFETIKADYPISRVVELLELELKPSGKQMRGKCPVCEGDSQRNLVITPNKGLYYCFSEQKGGDQLALIGHVKQMGVKDAAAWLSRDNPHKGIPSPRRKRMKVSKRWNTWRPIMMQLKL